MAKFRIVRDHILKGYYVAQVWRWYWPFWVELGGSNTFSTIEQAENYIHNRPKSIVKYVDG